MTLWLCCNKKLGSLRPVSLDIERLKWEFTRFRVEGRICILTKCVAKSRDWWITCILHFTCAWLTLIRYWCISGDPFILIDLWACGSSLSRIWDSWSSTEVYELNLELLFAHLWILLVSEACQKKEFIRPSILKILSVNNQFGFIWCLYEWEYSVKPPQDILPIVPNDIQLDFATQTNCRLQVIRLESYIWRIDVDLQCCVALIYVVLYLVGYDIRVNVQLSNKARVD